MSAEKRKSLGCRAQNPDTDSICAALLCIFKNQTENDKTYVAKRAGQ